jgi:DNA-binding NarL/FixJ family response regulator
MGDASEVGRAAFGQRAWGEAFEQLSAAADELDAADLQRLAVAAALVGRNADSERAWERAHLAFLDEGDAPAAGRCAFWLALTLLFQGEEARAGGWFARAERVVEREDPGCAARGLLLLPAFFQALGAGDLTGAEALAQEMVAIAQACGDKDLHAFGVLGLGQVAVAQGDSARGMRLLDEAMVAVTAGEVSPMPSGIVYCAVIEACRDAFDLRRAVSWTDAFHTWCAGQPDLVPYRGQCLVHRSEVLQAHGGWADAAAEAERACRVLSDPPHPAVGMAHYQQGELHRLRGEVEDADRAYRLADEHGRDPMPGLALLRLAEGKVDSAAAWIRRALEEGAGSPNRPNVLAAAVEVLLAAGDGDGARAAAAELTAEAEARGVPLLEAMAAASRGALLRADGETDAAVRELRRALAGWRELDLVYEAARARAALGLAYRELGNPDAAALELDAARSAFERLGARPDIDGLVAVAGTGGRQAASHALSPRELAVVRLLAAGSSNREIATELTISEHTVARHVQNIFAKLGVSSRTAAAAHAFRHGLA